MHHRGATIRGIEAGDVGLDFDESATCSSEDEAMVSPLSSKPELGEVLLSEKRERLGGAGAEILEEGKDGVSWARMDEGLWLSEECPEADRRAVFSMEISGDKDNCPGSCERLFSAGALRVASDDDDGRWARVKRGGAEVGGRACRPPDKEACERAPNEGNVAGKEEDDCGCIDNSCSGRAERLLVAGWPSDCKLMLVADESELKDGDSAGPARESVPREVPSSLTKGESDWVGAVVCPV